MSYVDAIHDRDTDTIKVVERVGGQRTFVNYPAKYVFYYDDPKGKHRTLFGTPCTRFATKSLKEFNKERRVYSGKKLYESDFKPVNRCLEEYYLGKDQPDLHVAFFDIEVDFDPDRGFSPTDDAFAPVTAITVYLSWLDQAVTLALPPPTISMEQAVKFTETFENCMLFASEAELLSTFLDLIDDADIMSGWNSEGYDIPYIVNRIAQVLSKNDTRRLCLWDQLPKGREYEKFGNVQNTYDLIGRVHLDYLQLYRKFTYEERHSYSLDAIGEYEVNERKTPYEGTLDQLYKQDFKKFIEYNRQDVMLLVKINRKLKLIDLVNAIAHQNTVLLPTTLGAVATTEQAIINEAHAQGLVIPDRKRDLVEKDGDEEEDGAAGAYVAYPKKGLHKWIGAVDVNSLYPSVIRAFNMGPETIVGQIRQDTTEAYLSNKMKTEKASRAKAWEGIFATLEFDAVHAKDPGVELVVDWETGITETYSAAQLYKLIYDSNKPWALTANGTIFTYEKAGIIPGLLERWYAERKAMQKKAKEATDTKEAEHWDRIQNVRKIQLNSLYGAILNPGCRFEDRRLGQSTTLNGRQVVKHMAGTINELFHGTYDHVGDAIIYGDTDSCFFSAYPALKKDVTEGKIPWTKDTVVQLYDQVAEEINNSFPDFMYRTFHVPHSKGEIIRNGRELVAETGLFITKKRYAVLTYDKEGKRKDVNGSPGETKVKGLDLRRADTPEFMQQFLQRVLMMVLTGSTEEDVIGAVDKFREDFRSKNPWQIGTPKRVNNLTKFRKQEESKGKTNMPGHVRAALNWNKLKKINSDRYSLDITDGQKVIVCKLKDNLLGMTSVAYPIDQSSLPDWFKELPFDTTAMEEAIIDAKLENLLGVLGWNVRSREQEDLFSSFFA